MVTLGLKQLCICNIVLFLLLLVSVNPHFSGLLLTIDDLIEIANLLIQLLPGDLKLPFKSLPFGVKCFICSHLLYMTLIKLIHVCSLPLHLLILQF